MQFNSLDVEVRRARRDDAHAIGAVFDAAVRAGWTYLGERVEKPMFAPHDWDQLVADHAPPNVLLVATDRARKRVRVDTVQGVVSMHELSGAVRVLQADLNPPLRNCEIRPWAFVPRCRLRKSRGTERPPHAERGALGSAPTHSPLSGKRGWGDFSRSPA